MMVSRLNQLKRQGLKEKRMMDSVREAKGTRNNCNDDKKQILIRWKLWIAEQALDAWKQNRICFQAVEPLLSNKHHTDPELHSIQLELFQLLIRKVNSLVPHYEGPAYILETFLECCLIWLSCSDVHEKIHHSILKSICMIFIGGANKPSIVEVSRKLFGRLLGKFLNVFSFRENLTDKTELIYLWTFVLESAKQYSEMISVTAWKEILRLLQEISFDFKEELQIRLMFLHKCATTLKSILNGFKHLDLSITPSEELMFILVKMCDNSSSKGRYNKTCFQLSKESCQILSKNIIHHRNSVDFCSSLLAKIDDIPSKTLLWAVWAGFAESFEDLKLESCAKMKFFRKLRGVAVNFIFDKEDVNAECIEIVEEKVVNILEASGCSEQRENKKRQKDFSNRKITESFTISDVEQYLVFVAMQNLRLLIEGGSKKSAKNHFFTENVIMCSRHILSMHNDKVKSIKQSIEASKNIINDSILRRKATRNGTGLYGPFEDLGMNLIRLPLIYIDSIIVSPDVKTNINCSLKKVENQIRNNTRIYRQIPNMESLQFLYKISDWMQNTGQFPINFFQRRKNIVVDNHFIGKMIESCQKNFQANVEFSYLLVKIIFLFYGRNTCKNRNDYMLQSSAKACNFNRKRKREDSDFAENRSKNFKCDTKLPSQNCAIKKFVQMEKWDGRVQQIQTFETAFQNRFRKLSDDDDNEGSVNDKKGNSSMTDEISDARSNSVNLNNSDNNLQTFIKASSKDLLNLSNKFDSSVDVENNKGDAENGLKTTQEMSSPAQSRASKIMSLISPREFQLKSHFTKEAFLPEEKRKGNRIISRASRMLALVPENKSVDCPLTTGIGRASVAIQVTNVKESILKNTLSTPPRKKSIRFDDDKNEMVIFFTDSPPTESSKASRRKAHV